MNALPDALTLRDYFAAQALCLMPSQTDYPDAEKVAHWAYAVADAMLKERFAGVRE